VQLSREADRALLLDKDLAKCSEDLRYEKLNVQNLESTLAAAHQQTKDRDLEARGLQATLESLSHQSDGVKTHSAKLQQEKKNLEARVRELEVNLQRVSTAASPMRKRARRPRSSSLSDFTTTRLESELDECRVSMSKKDAELRIANERLASLQSDLLVTANEKIALEKSLKSQLKKMEDSLEEKEEELQFLKAQQEYEGSNTREEDLLRRVEEDQAKITALEMLLRDNRELNSTKEALKRAEHKLRMEIQKTAQCETRLFEAVREREETLDDLDDARGQNNKLAALVREKEIRISTLDQRER
jgi:chromosome segregation ATPase